MISFSLSYLNDDSSSFESIFPEDSEIQNKPPSSNSDNFLIPDCHLQKNF